jgi:hypothetical protein
LLYRRASARAFKRPTGFDITAASEDRPQRVLQAAAIACALVYLYIREDAEEHPAPVRASPGVRVIEAVVAHLRQTFHQVVPYTLRRKTSCLDPSNWFYIRGDPLLDPMMLVGDRRKSQMDHFWVMTQSRLRSSSVASWPTKTFVEAAP